MNIIKLLGGLGVFLYGMKLMSESLQGVAGERLKGLLARMTANKFAGVLSGTAITITVQSSSATTVMVVSFVNAALLNLRQAIGVIMGANIGTTITIWLIAFLGFGKFKITTFCLPAIALGVAMLFTNRERAKGWGNVLIGFGFLFMGLDVLKDAVEVKQDEVDIFAFLKSYNDLGFTGVLAFIGIGTVLTIIVQSSSATTAITLALVVNGYIGLNEALAMILGENLGTTITANMAALAGNRNAKKAALAHTLFNVFGIVWMLFAFYGVIHLLLNILPSFFPGDPFQDKKILRFYLATFHTGFNVVNTMILIWFIPQLEGLASGIVDRLGGPAAQPDTGARFKFLKGGSVQTAEIAMIEAEDHNRELLASSLSSLAIVEYLVTKKYDPKSVESILATEEKLDGYRQEMLEYYTQIQSSGVTGETARKLLVQIDRIQALEETGDVFARIARKLRRANKNGIRVKRKKDREMIRKHIRLTREHYALLRQALEGGNLGSEATLHQSETLRERARKLLKDSDKRLREDRDGKHNVQEALLIADLVQQLDRVSHWFHEIVAAGS